jgi:hypothetical protein
MKLNKILKNLLIITVLIILSFITFKTVVQSLYFGTCVSQSEMIMYDLPFIKNNLTLEEKKYEIKKHCFKQNFSFEKIINKY